MAHILITGGNGQLGRALQESASTGHPLLRLTCTDMDTLDITSGESVDKLFHADPPDFVVNCAAYTAVDKAESEPDTARAINATGVKNLAMAAARHNTRMIHISTDYVFDGRGCLPYPTDHPYSSSIGVRADQAGGGSGGAVPCSGGGDPPHLMAIP
jgi:dTDP-4-dehydrorhamnose reductase